MKEVQARKVLDRLKYLQQVEEDFSISDSEVQNVITFLNQLDFNKIPSITLNEEGCFNIQGKQDNNNLMNVIPITEDQVNYVIFLSNNSPSILEGKLTTEDFLIYLNQLDLDFYK